MFTSIDHVQLMHTAVRQRLTPPKAPDRITFPPRLACFPTTISVPVHFFIVATNLTTSALIAKRNLEDQMNILNEGYKPLGINFTLESVHYHTGPGYRRFTQHKHENIDSTDKTGYFQY